MNAVAVRLLMAAGEAEGQGRPANSIPVLCAISGLSETEVRFGKVQLVREKLWRWPMLLTTNPVVESKKAKAGFHAKSPDPTPDEIRKAAAEIKRFHCGDLMREERRPNPGVNPRLSHARL